LKIASNPGVPSQILPHSFLDGKPRYKHQMNEEDRFWVGHN